VSATAPWWKGAVVYEIYVRSFLDSDGDGHGDLPGVIAKLEYIQRLGVDAIWLSPIHPSPNHDWGYDVSDYDGVHPDFGTMADFERLLAEAHQRGLKVLLDGVLSHTSDDHVWFQESLASRDNNKADWYVWADPKSDGTPPNNWLSAFGGPAWSYHPARRQYYHHKFLRQQPKLNWRNAGARAAALRVLSAWLARGVDGFRLDVANSYLHDAALTDNPPVPNAERTPWHWLQAPNLQKHIHDSNLPENAQALDDIRRAADAFADRFVFGEFYEDPWTSGGHLAPDKGLHSGYDFGLLDLTELSADALRKYYAPLAEHPDYSPCIAFSNHDVVRTVSRLGREHAGPDFAKLMLGLLFSLRGTILLYQGEELGLPQGNVARAEVRDPWGSLYYPYFKGRDGCRTPMPWDGAKPALGFSSGKPWLPVSADHRGHTVGAQEADERSPLQFARKALSVRKHAALRYGEMKFLVSERDVLAFERAADGETVLCVFNLAPAAARFSDPRLARGRALLAANAGTSGRELSLGAFGLWIGEL
jgi:alpha-glucosidase